jgi:hypothetical protein
MTHRCHWHCFVNFEFEYLGKFEVISDNTLRCETVAQGKIFEEKTEVENIVRLFL